MLGNSHQQLETFYERMNTLSNVFDLGYIQNTRLKISADYSNKIKMIDNLDKFENSISLPFANKLNDIVPANKLIETTNYTPLLIEN
jgi:hypothetical protein